MWTQAERDALIAAVLDLGHRADIEPWLARHYAMRASETPDGIEYAAPQLGGWIRVRYRADLALAVTLIDPRPTLPES